MVQEFLAYCVLAVVAAVAVWRVVRRFRRRDSACGERHGGGCAGCPLSGSCGKVAK